MNRLYQSAGPRYANELVGVFILAGLAVLIVAVAQSAHLQQWFSPGKTLSVILPQEGLYGLSAGAEVHVIGTRAGSVRQIDIDPESGRITARLTIRPEFANFIRTDSNATIRRKLAVAGDAYLEISRGTGKPLDWELAVIQATVDTAPTDALSQALTTLESKAIPALDHMDEAVVEIRDLVRNTNDPDGAFQQLVQRSASIAAGIDQGQGTVGRLVNDDQLIEQVHSLVAELQQTVEQLAPVISDLGQAATDIRSVAKAAQERSGELPQIIDGMSTAIAQLQKVLDDVRTTSADLPRISRNLADMSDALPGVSIQVQQTLKRVEQLAEQARRSWLLGGGNERQGGPRRLDPTEAQP